MVNLEMFNNRPTVRGRQFLALYNPCEGLYDSKSHKDDLRAEVCLPLNVLACRYFYICCVAHTYGIEV